MRRGVLIRWLLDNLDQDINRHELGSLIVRVLCAVDDLYEPGWAFLERLRIGILLNFAEDLAGLLEGFQIGTIRPHLVLLLQLLTHLLVKVVELRDSLNECILLLLAEAVPLTIALLQVRHHLLEQLESWACAVKLSQVVGQFEEVFEKDGYDLLESGLNPIVKLLVLGAVVAVALLVFMLLRLGEEIVEATHNQVDSFNFEFVFPFFDLVNLVP